jgi:hypothetical protein
VEDLSLTDMNKPEINSPESEPTSSADEMPSSMDDLSQIEKIQQMAEEVASIKTPEMIINQSEMIHQIPQISSQHDMHEYYQPKLIETSPAQLTHPIQPTSIIDTHKKHRRPQLYSPTMESGTRHQVLSVLDRQQTIRSPRIYGPTYESATRCQISSLIDQTDVIARPPLYWSTVLGHSEIFRERAKRCAGIFFDMGNDIYLSRIRRFIIKFAETKNAFDHRVPSFNQ